MHRLKWLKWLKRVEFPVAAAATVGFNATFYWQLKAISSPRRTAQWRPPACSLNRVHRTEKTRQDKTWQESLLIALLALKASLPFLLCYVNVYIFSAMLFRGSNGSRAPTSFASPQLPAARLSNYWRLDSIRWFVSDNKRIGSDPIHDQTQHRGAIVTIRPLWVGSVPSIFKTPVYMHCKTF